MTCLDTRSPWDILLIGGVSGSGKTTAARELNVVASGSFDTLAARILHASKNR